MVDPFLLAHAHASYISANQQAINFTLRAAAVSREFIVHIFL